MQRPHQITTTGVTSGDDWSSGLYLYDGAGNVKPIGSQAYQYDRMSRLLAGAVLVDGQEKTQSLVYDAFGNILSLTTDGSVQSTPVTTATNRLSGGTYDAGGNLTNISLGGEAYQYTFDPLNVMKYLQSDTGQARVFLYDADDARIMTFDCAFVDGECATPEQLTTTIRGLDGKVLRVYKHPFDSGSWDWERDYVYRDGQLLASVEPAAGGGQDTSHFHLDHLGSPRQITTETAAQAAFHTYYPFGGEATDPSQDDVQLKFTGHERDGDGSAGPGMLDYMHARYCSPGLGRFLSVDPVASGKPPDPQSWNKYSYGLSNPIKYVDPDGLESRVAQMVELAIHDKLQGRQTYLDDPTLQKAAIGATLLLSPVDETALLFRTGAHAFRAARALRGASQTHRAIVQETRAILKSKTFKQIRAAFRSGKSGRFEIGGRTIRIEPNESLSGMTGFGENGFVLGKEAFKSETELAKTILQELFRLRTSQASSGVTQSLATLETGAAAEFANSAFRLYFSLLP